MRIPLLAGRLLNAGDLRITQRVAVINEQLKKDVFGEHDPIGQLITFDFQQGLESKNYQALVVGVTGNVHHTSLASPPFREAYLPLDQAPLFSCDLVVRTANDPKAVEGELRSAIWSVDRDESVGTFETLNGVVDLTLAQPRFRTFLLGGFAAMAMLLSAAGLYGLLSFLISQRSREIGIRLALGASPTHILRLAIGKGLGLTAIGLLLGLSISFALTRFIATLVYGITTADPLTFVAGTCVLLLVSLIASFVPSRRAMKVNPVDVLRTD
jgi:putative ABC transport system permease protein